MLKVNASVRKLLSTIKAHLVSPARNREWTAHVAMPAAKEPLGDSLYSTAYNLVAIPAAGGLFLRGGVDFPMSVGAVAMNLSTIIVAANAQLLRRLKLQRSAS